ncbi:MAG TPA: hypothetical protein VFO60_09845 [Candidatus Dormibacteraeota bacterium]|nr:hypothetical protein [Candidatus Dormibacteraeota bacterium]
MTLWHSSATAAPPTTGSWALYPPQVVTTTVGAPVTSTAYQSAVQQPINPDGSSSWPAKRGVIPVQFSLQSATATTTTTTTTVGPVVFESLQSTGSYAYLDLQPSALTFNGITDLHATYAFGTGNCHGGALRWSIGTSAGNVFVYYGAYPNFTDCTTANQSGVNMTATGDQRVDTSQISGGTQYDTWAHAQTIVGSLAVTDAALVLDAGWGGDQVLSGLSNVTVNDDVFVPKPVGTTTSSTTTYGTFAPTCTLPTATISLVRNPGTDNTPIDETLAAQSSDTGGVYRQVDCKYIYNLEATSLGIGKYNVYVDINGVPLSAFGSFGLR